jgi:hypothetical protein
MLIGEVQDLQMRWRDELVSPVGLVSPTHRPERSAAVNFFNVYLFFMFFLKNI